MKVTAVTPFIVDSLNQRAQGAAVAYKVQTPANSNTVPVATLGVNKRLEVTDTLFVEGRSLADLEWYWDAVVKDLGVRWSTPYTRVLDDSRGIEWPAWFPGGRLNFTDNCVDRHVDAGRGAKPAILWEGDDGQNRTLTYAELAAEVNRLANGLKALGVGEGDRVGIFLPMSPEAAIATLAVVKIGAIYTPCFSGFGAGAVASRLSDCEATALITALPLKPSGRKAIELARSRYSTCLASSFWQRLSTSPFWS